jgi:hypothetical protein
VPAAVPAFQSGGVIMLRQLLLGVVVLGAAAPAYGQEVKMRWKFKEGEKFYVEDVQTTKTDVSVLGQQIKEEAKSTTVTSYTVKSVKSDSIVLVQKIESVDTKSQGGLGGASEKILEKMKGATFTLTVTPDGKVTKLEGFKEFAKKLAGDDDEMAKLLGTFFTEDLFKSSAEQSFSMLPDNPVKPGDTWTREGKMPVPGLGDFKLTSKYTYDGKADGGEKIKARQDLVYVVPKGGGDIGGIMKIVKGDLKAENGKGHYIFDPEKGRLVKGEMSLFIKGRLTVEFGGQNLDINLTTDQTTVTRVLDTNPAKD